MIVNASVESGALVALNKSDGSEAWRLPGTASAWSSPMLVDVPEGKPELVLNLAGKPSKIVGIDPATGKKLWSCEGNNDGYVCASVVSHDGVVYAIAGRSGRSVAVKAGGMGDVKELWTSRNDSRVNSPVYHDGHLYWLNEQRGTAMCIDAATGKEVYSQRISGDRTSLRVGGLCRRQDLLRHRQCHDARDRGEAEVRADRHQQARGYLAHAMLRRSSTTGGC